MTTIESHIRRIKLFERQFTKPVYDALHNEMKEAAKILRTRGIDALKADIDKLTMIPGLGVTIRKIYTVVGLWAAKRTLAEIKASTKETKAGFGFDLKWIEQILNFFRLYLLTKAVLPISQETQAQILSVLNKGEKEGWGIDRMAFELESAELTVWRARMIARTEIAKAQFYGIQLGEKDSEYETVKTWLSTHDNRTRHSHNDVDGTKVKSEEKFRVNIYRRNALVGIDLMGGPGDPDASAGNVINCRCTLSVRAARDKNGRIIPKQATDWRLGITQENSFVTRF